MSQRPVVSSTAESAASTLNGLGTPACCKAGGGCGGWRLGIGSCGCGGLGVDDIGGGAGVAGGGVGRGGGVGVLTTGIGLAAAAPLGAELRPAGLGAPRCPGGS